MSNKTLTTSYLAQLSNANHDGVTAQISERLSAFNTDNQLLKDAVTLVNKSRQAEDVAYKHYSNKDFTSDDLKHEDELEDKYMSTIQNVLNGLKHLPETEPMYRKAEMARQVFKDFDFATSDGYEAEARKTLNMAQVWQSAKDYTLAELGVDVWAQKAVTHAQQVLQYINQRIDNESVKVKGELASARAATDDAIRQAYDVINALAVLQPTDALNTLMLQLFAIEDRAKLYYISSSSPSGGDKPKPSDGGGDNPTPTPEPDPQPTPEPDPTPTPTPQPDPEPDGD